MKCLQETLDYESSRTPSKVPQQSKLEREALDLIGNWRGHLRNSDRAVVIGFLLSITPIFPACFVGFLISLLNYFLIRSDKLDVTNRKIVIFAVISGAIFTIFWFAVFFVVDPVSSMTEFMTSIFDFATELIRSMGFQNNGPSGLAV